jgi:hypothetical protein
VFSGNGATSLRLPVVENAVTFPDTLPLVYRIEAHNWAGPPANRVAVRATFGNGS